MAQEKYCNSLNVSLSGCPKSFVYGHEAMLIWVGLQTEADTQSCWRAFFRLNKVFSCLRPNTKEVSKARIIWNTGRVGASTEFMPQSNETNLWNTNSDTQQSQIEKQI